VKTPDQQKADARTVYAEFVARGGRGAKEFVRWLIEDHNTSANWALFLCQHGIGIDHGTAKRTVWDYIQERTGVSPERFVESIGRAVDEIEREQGDRG